MLMYMIAMFTIKYSKEEIEKINSFIDHERDFNFTYAGFRQVVDKYLVQDRSSGGVYEISAVHVYHDCADYLC